MNFKPLNDMILVKPDLIDNKIGLIHIPEGILKSGDKPGDSQDGFVGTVVAVGPGDRITERIQKDGTIIRKLIYPDGSRRPMLTKVGDRVVYGRRSSMPGGEFSLMVEGEKYVMFHEEQCALGVTCE